MNTIKSRRSIYNFKPENINAAILTEIFTYASWAPTHYLKEPWQIKIYQDQGKQFFVDAIIASYIRLGMMPNNTDPKSLKMIASMKKFLLDIPHHALIYFEKEADRVRYEEDYAAVCAFIQNAQLAAWEYGVGMLWTITPYMHDERFIEEIGLNKDKIKIAAVMQIGYPETIPRDRGRTPIEDKLEFVTAPTTDC